MSLERTRKVMDEYFDTMRRGEDFSRFFARDVVWTSMETCEQVSGRDVVRDHFMQLHIDFHWKSKSLFIADGAATLEGDIVGDTTSAESPQATARTPYCIVYEINNDEITAVRGYVFGLF